MFRQSSRHYSDLGGPWPPAEVGAGGGGRWRGARRSRHPGRGVGLRAEPLPSSAARCRPPADRWTGRQEPAGRPWSAIAGPGWPPTHTARPDPAQRSFTGRLGAVQVIRVRWRRSSYSSSNRNARLRRVLRKNQRSAAGEIRGPVICQGNAGYVTLPEYFPHRMTDRPAGQNEPAGEFLPANVIAFRPRLRFPENPPPEEPSPLETLAYELECVTTAIADAVQETLPASPIPGTGWNCRSLPATL